MISPFCINKRTKDQFHSGDEVMWLLNDVFMFVTGQPFYAVFNSLQRYSFHQIVAACGSGA